MHMPADAPLPAGPRAASAPGAPALEDEAVIRAVQAYRAALQAGQRPDRQEILRRFPDVAPALADCLEGLELLEQAAPVAGESGLGPLPPPPPKRGTRPAPLLGDFRLVREVGRGGMGVVYEAEQVSLGRRVALKVLPFAAALDSRQLQRFKHEAQAAACLHHGHIVPVYGVGCERGVHYYAMQFIEGQSLADLIDALRRGAGLGKAEIALPPAGARQSPAGETTTRARTGQATPPPALGPAYFRTAVSQCIQAAEALEYAHQLGVVHRDVKPANLLVDGRGHLWVTDFGLAHVRSDVPLTLSGELVGTLRYMSPEQAKARPGVVDQRADVYALGATLYELLTLEPAFRGQDAHELLHQIAAEEPRPPRRWNKAVPAELETIVLKALAKDPAERYPTAQELADDLRRFLEDKPIRARRPGPWQRLAKWSRRHRPLVAAGLIVLLTALAASVVSSVLVWDAYEEASDKGQRLQRTLKTALHVLDRIYLDLAEERLPRDDAAGREADQALLREAQEVYAQFARENREMPEVQREVGRARRRVADIDLHLARRDRAEDGYRSARDIARRLLAAAPGDREVQYNLAMAYFGLARVAASRFDLQPAQDNCDRSLAILAGLCAADPTRADYRTAMAYCHEIVGQMAWRGGNLARAAEHLRRAVAVRKELLVAGGEARHLLSNRQHLGNALTYLGIMMWERGEDPGEVESQFRAAREVLEKLLQDDPNNSTTNRHLGYACSQLAELLKVRRKLADAERFFRRAADCFAKAVALHRNVLFHQGELAEIEVGLGEVLKEQGRRRAARRHFDKAVEIMDRCRAGYVDASYYRVSLARVHLNRAEIWEAEGQLARAERAYRRALGCFEPFGPKIANTGQYAEGLAGSCFALGHLLIRTGRSTQARQLCRQVLGRAPDTAVVHRALAWRLATCPDAELRDPAEAVRRARKAVQAQADEANGWTTLGAAYYRAGNSQAALDALARAVRLTKGGDSCDWFLAALAHGRRGEHKQARAWYQRAIQDMEQKRSRCAADDDLRRLRAEAAALLYEPSPAPPLAVPGKGAPGKE
jgi:serine/threonine protein kinase/Tfp pilus assembly protein PilF